MLALVDQPQLPNMTGILMPSLGAGISSSVSAAFVQEQEAIYSVLGPQLLAWKSTFPDLDALAQKQAWVGFTTASSASLCQWSGVTCDSLGTSYRPEALLVHLCQLF